MIQLRGSKLWGKFDELMDRVMIKFYKLSDEDKIKELPEEAKKEVAKFFYGFKQQSDNYKKFQSDDRAKKPQLINDENDKTTTVIDTDYFKATTNIKIDFPYQSIGEIFKDKSLSTSEKSAMIDKYREAKGQSTSIIEVVKEYSMDIIDTPTIAEVPIDEVEEAVILQYEKSTKTPKELFMILCAKYPKKFVKAKVGSKGRVGWFKNYRKEVYTPTLITLNPAESKDYEMKCLRDSTVKYMADAYFVKGLNAYIYFVRTTE